MDQDMTYWEETIPADANPGPLVYAALATKLLALGWTLEDTVVIGARTHKVLKSEAAGNTYNLDWFLDISYPTTGIATGVLLCPFEGYTAASDVGLRGAYSAASTNAPDATTYSRFGATTSALETNWANTGSHTSLDTPLTTSAFVINASVTRDRVILLSSTEATQVSYCGFFTPTTAHATHAGAALFPLITTRLVGSADRTAANSAASVGAALTRIPKATTVSNWNAHCVVGPNTMRMNGRIGGAAAEGDNQITTVPFLVGMGGVSWTLGAATHIGELDGVECGWADAPVARGDIVTIDGSSYTLSTVTSSAAIAMAQV
jgi:hypothetical protein